MQHRLVGFHFADGWAYAYLCGLNAVMAGKNEALFPLVLGLYFRPMNRFLTKQEQWVLGLVLSLVLTGLAVKTYRTTHPPAVLELKIAKQPAP